MSRSILAALAIVFALAHVPYLASSLEDIDSVNFALGVRDFDVADHRPHPPGYPVYIALGKVSATFVSVLSVGEPASEIEARALSALSLLGALLALLWCYRVMAVHTAPAEARAFTDWVQQPKIAALAATTLTAACPLFWYLAIRPMSDAPGLAAALAAQASFAFAWWSQRPFAGESRLNPGQMGASGRAIVLGALLSGFAIGVRSQNALLTVPLLLGVLADRIGRGVAGAMLGAAVAFIAGVAVWAIPLILASGGWNAYMAALGSQAGEDFAGGVMLYTNPTDGRLAAFALLRTVIYPWDSVALGAVVVGLAIIGLGALMVHDRRSVVAIGLLSVPYAVFHLLFHDTTYVRYALPLVPPMALLAVRGAEAIAGSRALAIVGGLAVWAVAIAAPVTAAYASEPSPVARVVAAARDAAKRSPPGAVALHQTFRRPLQAEDFAFATQLASPPRREWLELTKYWREGHTAPLWFLADPLRSDLALVDPQTRRDRVDYAWRFQSLSNMGGMRPSAVRWYRMLAPGWFAGEGWSLSPETAGIARLMGRGPSLGPISAWVRRRTGPVSVLVGGRHLGAASDPPVRFAMAVDGREAAHWDAAAGFFLHEFELPPDALRGDGLAELTIQSSSASGSAVPTAVEQFDVQSAGTLMWGYDEGWHEAEFNTELGVWRWTSDRATLRIVGWREPIEIAVRVESPRKYFDEDPIVRLTAGGEVLGETRFADRDTWSTRVSVDALRRSDGRITIETNRTFVPAERGGPDQRRLGLRVFDVILSTQD